MIGGYEVRIKSSSGDFYVVSIESAAGKTSVTCECAAGLNGLLCKHRLAIFNFDETLLFDPEDLKTFDRACDLVAGSNIPREYKLLQDTIKELEAEKKAIQARILAAKTVFGNRLNRGI